MTRSMIHLIFAFVFNFFPPLFYFDFEGDVSGSGGWNTICFYISICVTAEVYLKQNKTNCFLLLFPLTERTHSIFVKLPTRVKLCYIHTCLGSKNLLFSVCNW